MKKGVEPQLQRKWGMQEPFLSTAMIIVEDCATFKPEEVWNVFLEHHSDANAPNFPTKKQFKCKLANEKNKLKHANS